jgi:DNA-binding NarL/FixJ family response regulator
MSTRYQPSKRPLNPNTGHRQTGGLTPREYVIAALASGGLSNKEIALRLGRSESTVKAHLHHVFCKTHVSNRTALVALINGYPPPQVG